MVVTQQGGFVLAYYDINDYIDFFIRINMKQTTTEGLDNEIEADLRSDKLTNKSSIVNNSNRVTVNRSMVLYQDQIDYFVKVMIKKNGERQKKIHHYLSVLEIL